MSFQVGVPPIPFAFVRTQRSLSEQLIPLEMINSFETGSNPPWAKYCSPGGPPEVASVVTANEKVSTVSVSPDVEQADPPPSWPPKIIRTWLVESTAPNWPIGKDELGALP
jgi:hypothetical protein